VQAKVSQFTVNPDTFSILLEKVRLYKQQQLKSHLRQTVIQNLQEGVSKTDAVIYLITLYLKWGEKHILKNTHNHNIHKHSLP